MDQETTTGNLRLVSPTRKPVQGRGVAQTPNIGLGASVGGQGGRS